MSFVDDPNDPRIKRGPVGGDQEPVPQHDIYLVLSEEERAKGFVRPLRRSYIHSTCGTKTSMSLELCETYARQPDFYGNTYCAGCFMHRPVSEFRWAEDDQVVGS